MKVSFVIPSFNCAAWLPHAVKSCLEQTYKDIEIIVVDDASTDSTGDYLDWLKHESRVKSVRLEQNRGRSEARNCGNRLAQGDIICVLDADDLSLPKRAELTVKKMPGCGLVYGSAVIIDPVGNSIGEERAGVFNKETAIETLKNKIVHSSMAYAHAVADHHTYQDGEIAALGIDDWAFQIEVALSGVEIDFIPATLCAYRQLSTGISKTRDEAKVIEAKKKFLASLQCPA